MGRRAPIGGLAAVALILGVHRRSHGGLRGRGETCTGPSREVRGEDVEVKSQVRQAAREVQEGPQGQTPPTRRGKDRHQRHATGHGIDRHHQSDHRYRGHDQHDHPDDRHGPRHRGTTGTTTGIGTGTGSGKAAGPTPKPEPELTPAEAEPKAAAEADAQELLGELQLPEGAVQDSSNPAGGGWLNGDAQTSPRPAISSTCMTGGPCPENPRPWRASSKPIHPRARSAG